MTGERNGRSLGDVTHAGGLDECLGLEALDGLVLRAAAATVVAADGLDGPAPFAVLASVRALDSHGG